MSKPTTIFLPFLFALSSISGCAPDLKSGAPICPDVPSTPKMIGVTSSAGTTYCIDSTEVTNEQYVTWLERNPNITEQLAECQWNTSFAPNPMPPLDDFPIVQVDWCDAYVFCESHGKRLCGAIAGGSVPFMESKDPTISQWHNACTESGAHLFPYGAEYNPQACNGADKSISVTVAVGTQPLCEGGFPGIHDMSGNVWEWEDACSGTQGGADSCRTRGGNFASGANDLDCNTSGSTITRASVGPSVGFRCCAQAL